VPLRIVPLSADGVFFVDNTVETRNRSACYGDL